MTLVAAIPVAVGARRSAGATAVSEQTIAVPAYFDPPNAGWTALEHENPPVSLVVMNPDSGPGTSLQASYVSAVRAVQAAGITVVGYVDTVFARRSLAGVEAQVDDYYRWYGVNGIFFDDASTACASEPYYAALNSYVKAGRSGQTTILNPGTATNRCYASAADILVTFEGSLDQYVHAYSAPAWVAGYPASHFWQIVYDVPTVAAIERTVKLSRQRGVGVVYVTRARLPNPYGALPNHRYWSAELTDVSERS